MLKRSIKYLIFINVLFLGLISCSDKISTKKVSKYSINNVLNSQSISSPITSEIEDSLGLINIHISYIKNGKQVKKIMTFRQMNGSYQELHLNIHFTDSQVDSIYTLAFSKKDTTFDYKFDAEKYTPSLPDGFDNWKYTIKSLGTDSFILVKNHLKDSTFKEEFIYNAEYHINKISLFYGGDTLVFGSK